MLAIFSTPLAGRDLTSGPNAAPWNTATEATTTGCQNQPESPLTAGHQRAPGASERVLSQPESQSVPGAYRTGDATCPQARLVVCVLAGPDIDTGTWIVGTVSVRDESGYPNDKRKVKTGSPGGFNNDQQAGTGVSFSRLIY
jgi:hypothetical protein